MPGYDQAREDRIFRKMRAIKAKQAAEQKAGGGVKK